MVLMLAGVAVGGGLLESEALSLNVGFVSRMTRGRPWLRLKVAASLDGKGDEGRIFLAAALKPFVLLVGLCALAAVVISIQRWFPEGRIKRALLFKVWD